MEARFGPRRSRLSAQPPRRPRHRCPGGDGVDRISGLNDDLLIQILVRLRCAIAAVRTSVLTRQWRDLWKHLPELFCRRILPDALEAALAQVVVPKLSLLDIDQPFYVDSRSFSPEGFAALLRTAARLDPLEIGIAAWVSPSEELIFTEVPSFARAVGLVLTSVRGQRAREEGASHAPQISGTI
ncbi:unnamed protein product [Urochloa humidicola]